MRRSVFICDLTTNCGPANINKKLKDESTVHYWDTKNHNIAYFLYNLVIFLRSKVVITSSNYRINYVLYTLANFMHKKTIYIMHGYNKLEHIINNTKDVSGRETKILNKSTLILPVSEKYMNIFISDRPEYKMKTHYLMNGIDNNSASIAEKRIGSVIVSGGNLRIKKNKAVCEAVRSLNNKGYDIILTVCGPISKNGERLPRLKHISVVGQVDNEDFKKKLSENKLFVLNSELESFSISAVEALQAGCNILISQNAGIVASLKTTKKDVIFDNKNIDEISDKILYNLQHDNNERISRSIDYEHYSWKNVASRFDKIVEYVANGKNIEEIRKII